MFHKKFDEVPLCRLPVEFSTHGTVFRLNHSMIKLVILRTGSIQEDERLSLVAGDSHHLMKPYYITFYIREEAIISL